MAQLRIKIGGFMIRYLESELIRYVIATVDNPILYLVFQGNNITFTKHISKATKTSGRKTAESILQEFYDYTGRADIELIILPIRISYEILQEEDVYEDGEYELLS